MKSKFRKKSGKLLFAAFVCLSSVTAVSAQNTPPTVSPDTAKVYVISAKAGGVNVVEGDVKVRRSGRADSALQILANGDELRDGDRVVTGADGKAEILLNPGSYLRVGENSEVELTSGALEALKIRVERGSALVEANAVGGEKGANISVLTAQTSVFLEKAGLYRVNASGITTEIYVWEGLARVGDQAVKSGRKLTVGAGVAAGAVAKFDRRNIDALDKWSAERAVTLAKLNDRLERRELETALASNSWSNSYLSEGYWVYDRRTRTWCYVPYSWASTRCCRAYRQNHNTAIQAKKQDITVPTVVVYNPRKYEETPPIDVITKGGSSMSGSSNGGSSSKSDSDWTPPASKSNSDFTPPPAKSEPPPPAPVTPPPSKSDSDSSPPPPSKKDGLR